MQSRLLRSCRLRHCEITPHLQTAAKRGDYVLVPADCEPLLALLEALRLVLGLAQGGREAYSKVSVRFQVVTPTSFACLQERLLGRRRMVLVWSTIGRPSNACWPREPLFQLLGETHCRSGARRRATRLERSRPRDAGRYRLQIWRSPRDGRSPVRLQPCRISCPQTNCDRPGGTARCSRGTIGCTSATNSFDKVLSLRLSDPTQSHHPCETLTKDAITQSLNLGELFHLPSR